LEVIPAPLLQNVSI